jgi:hypothetical protein
MCTRVSRWVLSACAHTLDSLRLRIQQGQKTIANTLSTSLESDLTDVWASPLRAHPHETNRHLQLDPDRIGAVFCVPQTEMAEI